MSRIDLNRFRTGFISSLLAATVAICTLPLFIYREKTKAAVLSQNALVSESDTKAAGYSSEKAFRDAVLSSCQRLEGVKYEWGGGGWNGSSRPPIHQVQPPSPSPDPSPSPSPSPSRMIPRSRCSVPT